MNSLNILVALAETFTGLVITVCSYLALESMSARTKHCLRFAFLVMLIAGLAMVLIPLYDYTLMPYAQAALGVGFAIYIALDRRRIDKLKGPVLALFMLLAISATPEEAQAREKIPNLNAVGCALASDMAVVARALSQADIKRETANAIMARIYVSDQPVYVALRDLVTDRSYSSSEEPTALMKRIHDTCLENGGAVDKVFGMEM